jgi:flagellin
MRINTNVEAFNAQRNLQATGLTYAKSVEKLSSGLRINRAGDDAAGLSISEKLRGQIKGLAQAQRNAQDGISMIQTGEGALNEVHSMLQRMRELAVQASNDTLSGNDRTAINSELQQLQQEVHGVSGRTQFNGKTLLTGSLANSVSQTGVLSGTTFGAAGASAVLDASQAKVGTTFSLTGGSGKFSLIATTATSLSTATAQATDLVASASEVLSFGSLGVNLTSLTGSITVASGASNANFQIGSGAANTMSVGFSVVDLNGTSTGNGTNASGDMNALQTSLNNFNGTQTVAYAQQLITDVDKAINYVSSVRGTLGASQNRLEHTIANLGVAQENMTASESRIRDTDMAAEMVNFTKTGILQQAGQAILAQANQAPAGVMSLLR